MNTSTQELCGATLEHSTGTLSFLNSFYHSCWHEYGHLGDPNDMVIHTCNPITPGAVTTGAQTLLYAVKVSLTKTNAYVGISR